MSGGRRRALGAAFLWAALVACTSPTDPSTPWGRGTATARRLAGSPQARRLSCEARSAADLLAAHGITVSEAVVLGRLPRSDNPDVGFVGDPDGAPGGVPPAAYGVHEGPVAAVLRGLGLDARAERGRDLAWLAAETSAGRPVIAWVTGSCHVARPVVRTDAAGRSFTAVSGEHTVLVLAVRRDAVLVLDPGDGRVRTFEADELDAAWALLGRRAVSAAGRRVPTTSGDASGGTPPP